MDSIKNAVEEKINVVLGGECDGAKYLEMMPRKDKSFGSAPRDWSELPPLLTTDCPASQNSLESGAAVCSNVYNWFNMPASEAESQDISELILNYNGPPGWPQVIQAYGVFGGIAAVMAVVSFLFLVLFCCTKFVCCIKSKVSKKAPKELKPESTTKALFCYTSGILCLFTFIIWVIFYAFAGNSRGNLGFTETQKVIVTESLVGASEFIAALPPVADKTVSDMGSITVVKLFGLVGSTLSTSLNLGRCSEALGCAVDTLDLFGEPQVQAFIGLLDDVAAALQAFPDFDAMTLRLTNLESTIQGMDAILTNLQTFLSTMKSTLQGLSLSAIETGLQTLSDFVSGDITTSIGALRDDLVDLQANLPTSQELTDTTTALNAFQAAPATATADAVLTELTNLRNKLSQIPDGISTSIGTVQGAFSDAVTLLDGLVSDFQTAENQLDLIPSAQGIEAALLPLADALSSLDLTGVKGDLIALSAAVTLIPRGARIRQTIQVVYDVAAKVPCILQFVDELESVNETLFTLPAELNSFGDINSTVNDATAQIDDMNSLFDDLDGQLNSLPNTTEYIKTIDGFQTELDSTASSLDISSALEPVESSRSSFNLTEVTVSMQDLSTQLGGGVPVSPTDLADLDNFGGAKQTAVSAIQDAIDAVQAWKDNMDPKAGVCPDLQECGPTAVSQPCAASACSWDTTSSAIDAAKASIAQLSSDIANLMDIQPVITSLNDASNQLTNVPSIDASKVSDLQTNIDGFLPQIDEYISTVDGTKTGLSGDLSSLDISNTIATIDDAKSQLDDATSNLDGYYDILDGVDSQMATLQEQRSMLSALRSVIGNMTEMFTQGGLTTRLQPITGENVLKRIREEGLYSGIVLVAETIDSVVDAIYRPAMELMDAMGENETSTGEPDPFNATADALSFDPSVFDILTRASQKDLSSTYGHTFYVLSSIFGSNADSSIKLISMDTYESLKAKGTVGVDGIYNTGSKAEEYPNGAFCVTDECLENTITIFNSYPLNGAPTSREGAFRNLFLLPLLLLVFAILALVCACRGGTCTTPFVFCGCGLAFFLYLVSAALMPMALVFSDVCDNIVPLASSQLDVLEPYICETLNMTFHTNPTGGDYCIFEVDDSSTIEIDADQIAASLLNGCKSMSSANTDSRSEPIMALWSRVGELAHPLAQKYVDQAKDNQTNFGPKLLDLMDDSAEEIAKVIERLSEDFKTVAGCERLSGVVTAMLDPICCNLRTSIFYLIVPWFMIAIGISSCVLPILCCTARKRGDAAKVAAERTRHAADLAKARAQEAAQLAKSKMGK